MIKLPWIHNPKYNSRGVEEIWIVSPSRKNGADGTLVGFGGGLEVKRRLLELEGNDV